MLEEIFQMIVAPELQRALLPLKIVFLFLSILTVGLIIYFLIVTTYLKFVFFDAWEDHRRWKDVYSFKAKKRASDNVSARVQEIFPTKPSDPVKSSISVQDVQSAPAIITDELEGESPSFKDGRIKRSDWERVLGKLESNQKLNYKLAFIDANKLFDQALEKQGKELSKEVISNAIDIIEAKDALGRMLTDPEAELSLERAKELVAVYQKAISQLS